MLRIRLTVELTLRGPILTHASGAGELGIDSLVATLPDGRCYLPFSLVKGRIRQSWEELGIEGGEEWFGARNGGWSATRGHFRFSDFVEVPSEQRSQSLHTKTRRHRIQIDEQTGAADDGALQVIESPFAAGEEVVFQGEVSFFHAKGDPRSVTRNLEHALRWTTSLGAERTIGFGRVAGVRITDTTRDDFVTVVEPGRSNYEYIITLRDPFCFARRRIAENLFETDEVIPGSAVRGVAATTLNEILGRRTSEVIGANTTNDPHWEALGKHFNAISISHAFPSNGTRPVEPPLSIVQSRKTEFPDVALQEGPGLIDGEAPQFAVDWKGDALRSLRGRYGWPDLRGQKEIRVRTSIDRERRRAKEAQLFSYEMIRPQCVNWYGRAGFSAIPDHERAAVVEQFQRLFALEPAAWGKTKARGSLKLVPSKRTENQTRLAELPWVVTLQTPALLCDPARLDESSGRAALFDAYASAWDDVSRGSVRLVRFFAQQSLAGGYVVHRFRAGERYAPFLLTNPGSVFVLEPSGEGARQFIAKIANGGLPLPAWAIARYGESWTGNPFLPDDGFGEVVVNLPCHREPIPTFTLVERWKQTWNSDDQRAQTAPSFEGHSTVSPLPEETQSGTTQPVAFGRRWVITANIRTTTELHIGSGEPLGGRLTRTDSDGNDVDIEVSAVAVDSERRAYLPGSGVKGALRSWLLDRLPRQRAKIEQLFGVGGDSNISYGGKVDVHDAHAATQQPHIDNVPHWDGARLTGVTASAAIDRTTRTARDEKLFHREYVPAGVTFHVTLSGDGWSDDEAALLVFVLLGFEATPPLQLGAETREGWGCFAQSGISVRSITPPVWRLAENNFEDRTVAVLEKAAALAASTDNRMRLPIEIAFSGPFLVNEPSRTKQGRTGEEGLPNHAQRVGTDGKVVLPVSSFRGALRSRAEKIIRTIGGNTCRATDPKEACKAIDSAAGARSLCLVCQLFGAPGWAAPIGLGSFRLTNVPQPYHQELVAVDRFTGSVSGSAKFNVRAVWKPVFASTLTVDVTRWKKAELTEDLCNAALGLLILVLRDLADGDMTLGFGASKGYGGCTATVDWPTDVAKLVDALHTHLGVKNVAPLTSESQQSPPPANTSAERTPPAPNPSDTKFYNPYHFVPVGARSPETVDVDRLESTSHLSHASWANGTYSGRMICRITTLTPLVIGAKQTSRTEQPADVQPFRHPDTGLPAIPSTSLRGLFSSIAEAASNSALRILEDKPLYRTSVKKGVKVDGTVHDFFEKVSPELLPMSAGRSKVSIAEQIFGFVENIETSRTSRARAFAGKVRFSMAETTRDEAFLPAVALKILSSPRPPSPALYFRPNNRVGYISKAALSRDMDRPHGRKAYLHHPAAWHGSPWATADATKDPEQKNEVTPVRAGVEFLFHVDFDNLTPMQLGLLCYALRPTSAFRHKLGMGKSLGLGSVRVDPLALLITDRKVRYTSTWPRIRRFHQREVFQESAQWSAAYPEEARVMPIVCASPIAPADALRQQFRKAMLTIEPSILDAIETIGDPNLWPHPIHTPQVAGAGLEEETFKWFVRNDSGNVASQFLRPVGRGKDVTLSRVFAPLARNAGRDRRPAPELPAAAPEGPQPPARSGPPIERWNDVTLAYEAEQRLIIASRTDGMSAKRRAEPTDDDVSRINASAAVKQIVVRREPGGSHVIVTITFA